MLPKIICACPTYKRPKLLANAAACFLAQTYPKKHLFIYDDAGQFNSQQTDSITLVSTRDRESSLPVKYNRLFQLAKILEPDIIAIWEDDDVWFPWHLESIVEAVKETGAGFIRQRAVYETFGQPIGTAKLQNGSGMDHWDHFHGGWAYSAKDLYSVGGYPEVSGLDFDLQLVGKLREIGVKTVLVNKDRPSYVYRYGNGHYQGSQCPQDNMNAMHHGLSALPGPFVGPLIPQFDDPTKMLYKNLAGVKV